MRAPTCLNFLVIDETVTALTQRTRAQENVQLRTGLVRIGVTLILPVVATAAFVNFLTVIVIIVLLRPGPADH